MPTKKISRKKLLKEPDEFISTTAKTIQFFRTYQRPILRSAIIVLIVAVAAAGGFYYLRWQEEKALAIQDQALKIYQEAYRSTVENPATDKKEDFKKGVGEVSRGPFRVQMGKNRSDFRVIPRQLFFRPERI